MNGKIAACLQDGEVFFGERLAIEWVDFSILGLLRHCSRRLMSLELRKGTFAAIGPCLRFAVGLIGVHVRQIGIVPGIHVFLLRLLSLRTRPFSVRTPINHDLESAAGSNSLFDRLVVAKEDIAEKKYDRQSCRAIATLAYPASPPLILPELHPPTHASRAEITATGLKGEQLQLTCHSIKGLPLSSLQG